MRLTMLGGGGFRTPLVYGALLARRRSGADEATGPHVDEVVLYDVDARRLEAIAHVLAQSAYGHPDPPAVRTTTDLAQALDGADFVFSALRVGGLVGRTTDERVALDAGVLGQETTGAGGIAFGIRTIPVALRIAEQVRRRCPDAWLINFTNPAGMITQALRAVLGERVIGICDSPVSLVRHALGAVGRDDLTGSLEADPARADRVEIDYAGLNHLGWLQSLRVDGVEVLPQLLADEPALAGTEEGRLFGTPWLRSLGCLPNEYLYYYYFARDAREAVRDAPRTRGEYLLTQQNAFYTKVSAATDQALNGWRGAVRQRNASYLAELRDEADERDPADIALGGYEEVALALMRSLAGGTPSRLILNVPGGGAVAGLPADAVVEVPCRVDAAGPHPLAVSPLPAHARGLVQQVKAVEEAAIAAAVDGSPTRAVEAFALHPLVDSVTVARRLVADYRERIPEFAEVFNGTPPTW